MHTALVFLACALVFAAAFYGLARFAKWRNDNKYPWD